MTQAVTLKMGVSAAVTMDTGMFIFCACADALIHCCLSIKWMDQGVVYPIRLWHAWLKNKGVRIIEVLLYRVLPTVIGIRQKKSEFQPTQTQSSPGLFFN